MKENPIQGIAYYLGEFCLNVHLEVLSFFPSSEENMLTRLRGIHFQLIDRNTRLEEIMEGSGSSQFLTGIFMVIVFGLELYVLSKLYGVPIYQNDFKR